MTYLTEDEFDKHLRHMMDTPILAVDTEGTINHPFSTTWGASTGGGGVAEYFAFNHMLGNNLPHEWLPRLKETIEYHPCIVMHNAKHDLRALRSMGINYTGKFYDTMLMAHMVNENIPNKSLDNLSRMHGGEPKRSSELQDGIIKAFGWDYIPVDIIRPYGANDAFITEGLFHSLYPDFQNQGFDGELWDYEQEFTRLLMDIEDTGVLVDQSLAEQELERGLKIMQDIENSLGFSPSSPIQLGKFLLEDMGLPVVGKRTKKGKPSFNKDNMEIYDELLSVTNDNRAKLVLAYRGWQKTTSSNYRPYLELLNEDGRLRPNFKIHGTKTGRLSCEQPNLQQIPRSSAKDWNGKLKLAFITDPGRTGWEFDYRQLEFRLGAAYAHETRLIDAFNDRSRDVFDEMALDLHFSRDQCKTLNYTIQFGGGGQRISEVFGVSQAAGYAIKDNYYKKYPGLAVITNMAKDKADDYGYVKYWTGRRRHFQYPEEHRKAFNSVCQGGAFEIVKRQAIECKRRGLITEDCKLDLTVHDSLRFDITNGKEKEYIPEIIEAMEDAKGFGVEFHVEVNKWGTKEKWVA